MVAIIINYYYYYRRYYNCHHHHYYYYYTNIIDIRDPRVALGSHCNCIITILNWKKAIIINNYELL